MGEYVVYAWCDLYVPFYIGMGTTERAYHLSRNNQECMERYRNAQLKNTFSVKILEDGLSKEQAIKREKAYIKDNYSTLTNYCLGGNSMPGDLHPMYGRTHSELSKEKMRKAKQGTTRDQKTKDKISLSMSKGKIQTPHGIFNSISEASRILKLSRNCVNNRVTSKNYPFWHKTGDMK